MRRKILGVRPREDDAALVSRVQAGDEQAFATLFTRHYAPLLSYCRHMLGSRDEGEDALQQAFIKAHRALVGGTAPRELRPWLYAIARNCCLSAIAARRPTSQLQDDAPALAGLSEEVHQREDLRELLAGIGRLPEDQRSALLLAELDDLSHQAIAAVVGCQVSKVKALVYQARSALIADRDALQTPCRDIREELSVARGGELRRGPLRRHLKLCAGCRDYQLAVGAQRQSLACVLPVVPSAGLTVAILGHAGAHAAGAAGIGGACAGTGGAGAAGTPAAGGVGTSAGVAGSGAAPLATSAGAGASGGSGLAASGTVAASTSAGAGVGGGTSLGGLIGGGVVGKLAVGGAIAALAAAGTVVAHRRLPGASSSRVSRARLASFAARGDRAVASAGANGASDAALGSIANDAVSATAGTTSSPALDGAPGSFGSVVLSPFATATSGAGGAQVAAPLTGTSTLASSAPPASTQVAAKAGQVNGGATALARARGARAQLWRQALRRRALRLQEARRRARLRKARQTALRRAHRRVAAKPVKPAKPPVAPLAPAPRRPHRHRADPPSAATGTTVATNTSGTSTTTKGKTGRSHPALTGPGSAKTTGTAPETGASGSEKAGLGTGKSKVSSSGSGSEKAGSSTGKSKASSSGTGGEKSAAATGGNEASGAKKEGSGAKKEASGAKKEGSGAKKEASGAKKEASSSKTGKTGSEAGSGVTPVESEQLPNL